MCDEDCKSQVYTYESCAQQAVESGDCDNKMEGDEMQECLEDFCYDEMLSVKICEYKSPNCENDCPDCSSQVASYYQCIYNGRTDHCTERDDETELDEEGNTAMDQCAQALCTMEMTVGMTCMEQNNCGDDEPQPEPTCAQGCHTCNGSGSEDCQTCEEGFELKDDDSDGTGECVEEDGDDVCHQTECMLEMTVYNTCYVSMTISMCIGESKEVPEGKETSPMDDCVISNCNESYKAMAVCFEAKCGETSEKTNSIFFFFVLLCLKDIKIDRTKTFAILCTNFSIFPLGAGNIHMLDPLGNSDGLESG